MRIARFAAFEGVALTALHFAEGGGTLAAVFRLDTWVAGLCWWDLERHAPIVPAAGDPEHACRAEEDAGLAPDPAVTPDHRFLAYVSIERGPESSLRFVDRSAPKRSKRRERRLTALPWGRHHSSRQEYCALAFTPDGGSLVAVVAAKDAPSGAHGVYRWAVGAILRGRGPESDGDLLPDPAFIPTPEPDATWAEAGLSRGLAFAPDGSSLAAGFWNAGVLRRTFPDGEELPAPPARARRQPRPIRVAFSPDGAVLAVADRGVALYNARTARRLRALPTGPNVRDLAFDPSGRVLATVDGAERVRFWDPATGEAGASFDWGIGPVTAVAFAPDGCRCAAAGGGGKVAVWDVTA